MLLPFLVFAHFRMGVLFCFVTEQSLLSPSEPEISTERLAPQQTLCVL